MEFDPFGLELESSLAKWNPPQMAPDIQPCTTLALNMAWETIRKAAYIYLWRRTGFNANLLQPMRLDRQTMRDSYVTEIISNIKAICSLARTQRISIGNAMLWPLAVIGCECGYQTPGGWDEDVIGLLDSLHDLFSMHHTTRVKEVFQVLWQMQRDWLCQYDAEPAVELPHLSLNSVAMEMNLVLPLL